MFYNNLSYQELVIEIFDNEFGGRVSYIENKVKWITEELKDEYIWMCPRWKEVANYSFIIIGNVSRPLIPISPEKFMKIVEEYVRVRDL